MPPIRPDRLLWCLPILYVAAAIRAVFSKSLKLAWRHAEALSFLGLITAVAAAVFLVYFSLSNGPAGDAAGCTMAVLVSLLGWVIVRFSRHYLAGEPGQAAYVSALMLVMAAVSIVVQSKNLAVILVAWAASSLALHRLLTFYPERPGAMLAAHKKFIVSRLAELCIAGALILFYLAGHSLSLSRINALGGLPAPHGGWFRQPCCSWWPQSC